MKLQRRYLSIVFNARTKTLVGVSGPWHHKPAAIDFAKEMAESHLEATEGVWTFWAAVEVGFTLRSLGRKLRACGIKHRMGSDDAVMATITDELWIKAESVAARYAGR